MGMKLVDDAKAVRFPPGLFERARRLRAPIADDPEIVIGQVSTAAVLRLAALEGLSVLERRYTNGEKP